MATNLNTRNAGKKLKYVVVTLSVITLTVILLYSKQPIDLPTAADASMPQEVRDAIATGDFRAGIAQIAVYAKQKASAAQEQAEDAIEDKVPPSSKSAKSSHKRQRIVLSFKNDTPRDFDSVLQTLKDMEQVKVIELSTIGLVIVEVPNDWNLEWLIALLRVDETIKDIGHDYPVRINTTRANDPDFIANQAYMNSINITEAWDYTTGNPDVIVAVIDTGIDYMYDELAPNLWVNQVEVAGVSGQDDDNNGCVDDIYGCDYVNGDGDPWDDNRHGTNVASLIGMQGNNRKLGAGVNWDISIMSLKVLDYTGSGSTSDILQAFHYILTMRKQGHNVRVINMSLGGAVPVSASETPCAKQNLPSIHQMVSEVIDMLGSTGVLSIVAAGNDGANLDSPGTSTTAYLPACMDNDSLISVASSNDPYSQALSSFSNYGKRSVDLAAPGLWVYTVGPSASAERPQQRNTTITTNTVIFDDTINQTTAGWIISRMISNRYIHCEVSGGWERVSSGSQNSYWTESREGNSPNCADLSLTRESIDLSQYGADDYIVLTFLLKTALELNRTPGACASVFCDVLFIEITADGESWSLIDAWSGMTQERRHSVTIPRWAYREGFQFRFRFVSDPYTTLDGVEIRDILLVRQATGSDSSGDSSGTSFASPIVAGVAGLLASFDPTLSATQTRSALLNTVNTRSQFSSRLATGGFLNAGEALYSIADDGIHAILHPSIFERGGQQGQLSVRLTRKPQSSTSITDVVLDIAPTLPLVLFSTSSLTFTQSNWHVPQIVNFSVIVGGASSTQVVISVRDQDSATQYHSVTDTTLSLEIVEWQVSISDRDTDNNIIAENAPAGSPVRQLRLQAIDGRNHIISASTWSLSVNPEGLFAIQSTSGVVRLAYGNALDYETTQSYIMVVTAVASRYNTALTASLTITVMVANAFEQLTIVETDGDATNNLVSENATTNTLVSNLQLQAQDEAMRLVPSVQWQLVGEMAHAFRVSTLSNSVRIETVRLLDYETSTQFIVIVQAVAHQQSITLTSHLTVTVMVANVFEQLAIVETDGDTTNNVVPENAATNTLVSNLQLQAQDEAMRLLPSVQWQLVGEMARAFRVSTLSNPTSIETVRPLDYETSTQFTIVIQAIAHQQSMTLTSHLTVTVIVANVFERLTIVETDGDPTNNVVSENAATNTLVSNLQLQAQDEAMRLVPSVQWQLVGEMARAFRVSTLSNPTNIATTEQLDYEMTTQFMIVVQAIAHQQSITLTSHLTVTVIVVDVFEQLTIVETDGDATNNVVPENATTNTLVSNLQLQAQDGAMRLVPSVQWQLVGEMARAFRVSTLSNSVRIETVRPLDYETSTQFIVIVQAVAHQQGVTLTSHLTVTIVVANVFEQLTIVETDGDTTNNVVPENAATNTLVSNLQLQAQDEAMRLLPSVQWQLVGESSATFRVNALSNPTGIETVRPLDYETSTQFIVIVQAVAHQQSITLTSHLTVTAMVANVFERLTIVETDGDPTNNVVSENAATNTLVSNLQLQAQDEAMRLVPSVQWQLFGESSATFKVSTLSNPTGIETVRPLDYEASMQFTIVVQAIAHQQSITLTSCLTVTVMVVDVFEQLTIVETDGDTTNNVVSENAATNTLVPNLQLQAQDEAMRLVPSVQWQLFGEMARAFRVSTLSNPTSIETVRPLDYEMSTQFTIVIQAIAHQQSMTLTSHLTVTVRVANVFEQLTIVETDGDPTNNVVSENAATNTLVSNLQLQAQDEAMRLVPSVQWRLVGESVSAFQVSTLSDPTNIATTEQLDYEMTTQFTIVVQAIAHQQSMTLTSHLTVTVRVANVFEQLTIVETDGDITNNVVSENAATNTLVSNLQLQAQDEAIRLLPSVQWQLVGESSATFRVNALSNPTNIATTEQLDYETSTRFMIIIQAIAHQAGMTLTSHLTVTIMVANVFEQLAIVETDGDPTNNVVSENAATDTLVSNLQLQAQDEAMRLVPSVQWQLVGESSSVFRVSTLSNPIGIETVRPLDYETSTQFMIVVQAIAHQQGMTLTSHLTVTVMVANIFERLTIVETDGDITNNVVPENAATHTLVSNLQLQAQDEAMRLLPSVQWQLVGESSATFRVNALSNPAGVETVRPLDYETNTQFMIVVQAIAHQQSITLTSHLTTSVSVTDAIEDIRLRLRLFLEGVLQ